MKHLFIAALLFISLYSQPKQLVVVTTPTWESTQGTLQLYEYETSWNPIGPPIPVVVGKKGLTLSKQEGDLKSPAGRFPLRMAFGFSPQTLHIPYVLLHEGLEAVDDPQSRFYNQIVDRTEVTPDWRSSEKMRSIPLYELGVVIDYNTPPIPGAGSAIFFHIWRSPTSPTAGCTAMSQDHLLFLLQWLDIAKDPLLVQLPLSEYSKRKKEWNLP